MADNSAIEWTDATWNPIRARNIKTGKVGWHCEHATTGCEFCYAEGFNRRLGTRLAFKPGHRKDIELFLDEEMLMQPLRWKKPRKIFVGSMTDLFAEFVPDELIDRMFAVMALATHHTFQVLTKRARRMREYTEKRAAGAVLARDIVYQISRINPHPKNLDRLFLPLPNVWLGVSTERQQEADERIPLLLHTPAATRFISAEPLLGPINLTSIQQRFWARGQHMNSLTGEANPSLDGIAPKANLDWVIVGGESGPNARSMHPEWVKSLRDQCEAAGVPFFFKQWGEWMPSTPDQARGNPRSGWQAIQAHPHVARAQDLYPQSGAAFVEKVGKKVSGRLLDDQLHNAMPAVKFTGGLSHDV